MVATGAGEHVTPAPTSAGVDGNARSYTLHSLDARNVSIECRGSAGPLILLEGRDYLTLDDRVRPEPDSCERPVLGESSGLSNGGIPTDDRIVRRQKDIPSRKRLRVSSVCARYDSSTRSWRLCLMPGWRRRSTFRLGLLMAARESQPHRF
jgi:hypothetical protein